MFTQMMKPYTFWVATLGVVAFVANMSSCQRQDNFDSKTLLAIIDSGEMSKARFILNHIDTNPMESSPDVRYCWGYWFEKIGNLDSALIYYNLNLSDAKSNRKVDLLATGRVHFLKGDYREAFNLLWDVQRLDSCFGDVRYYLGMTLWEMGQKQSAIYSYQNQLRCDPEDTTTLHNLALCYSVLRKYDEQIETLLRKQRYHYSTSDMLDLSLAYHRSGNDSIALSTLSDYDNLVGASARSLTYRANIWYNIGQRDSALASLSKAIALDSSYDETVNMTKYLYKQDYLRSGSYLYEFAQRKR